jgi:predicted polyphosphate/ATP-dependent NAD kinase
MSTVSAGDVVVGVIANPASGRDIRRLVSGASVFDNAEKGNMTHRLMCGLGATGVDRVVMMPAGFGVGETLRRSLRGNAHTSSQRLPHLEVLDQPLEHTAEDTVTAVKRMRERGVKAIVVLGGDGTHRIVAQHSGEIPLCALSTGTNNTFPEMREATVAGLATGLVATDRASTGPEPGRREKMLHIGRNGDARADCALVDVAVTSEPWVGARAIWRISSVSDVFVTFARADAIGLSAIAAQLEPVERTAAHGLHVRLTDVRRARLLLHVPIAPGMVETVGVLGYERMEPGRAYRLPRGFGSLALDGEREIELTPDDEIEVRLGEGPVRIDVSWVMAEAARRKVLSGGEPMA